MGTSQLLLLRHGLALDRELAGRLGLADQQRPLTEEGRQRTAWVVEKLVGLGLGCDQILSSPLLRASETADLALAGGLAPRLKQAPELAPEADPLDLLLPWLGAQPPLPGWRRLCLVGHEPDLSGLAARLCGAPPGALRLRKAGVALLELPAGSPEPDGCLGRACLMLLLTPRSLSAPLRRP
ncbi:histidine phosphatase family protein [Synechococcus sp. CS-602]|uniref:SixA phosphatase family protein n=1 Tax=Synechococcus sp. CS-602 TaxID=2847982 RepID=UPI00223B9F25|nr:histidine phosphatase family protein [Synechococcus sp. CS-602]MCT0205953.1 histidine phosphatase family protein [Synechococcus sp. CS-602]MCT4364081.1 histidine phosphatase family protein [Candidatus Regnicoccus frigidus MAG-AL1]